MAYINKEDQAAASRKHYLANTDKIKARARIWTTRQRKLSRKFVDDYLSSHPCVDCSEADIVVLEFDHVRGEKRDCIARMVTSCSIQTLMDEISKCEVRCANCHRRRHCRSQN